MTKGLLKEVLTYYLTANTVYGVHSPFVYALVDKVIRDKIYLPVWSDIEDLRQKLISDSSHIPFIEYGAGSKRLKGQKRKISQVAKSSLSSPRQCRVMYRLVDFFRPKVVLEMGTSFGISTAYLASAHPDTRVITMEGNPSSAHIAQDVFDRLGLKNINLRIGKFSGTLPGVLKNLDGVDLAFIDGHHTYDATISYFHALAKLASKSTVILVDDIYWSEGMNHAWKEIRQDDRVAFTVDIFSMGMVFFNHEVMPKQHFRYIDFKYKPWNIGLFGGHKNMNEHER